MAGIPGERGITGWRAVPGLISQTRNNSRWLNGNNPGYIYNRGYAPFSKSEAVFCAFSGLETVSAGFSEIIS